MPAHLFPISRFFAEVVRHDAHQIGAQQIFRVVENALFVQQVVYASAVSVPAVDGVTVVTGFFGALHQRIKIRAVGCGFL